MITIASSLPTIQNEFLRKHESAPGVFELTATPWIVPAEADALFTFQTQWREAPRERPDGWPFNLKWVQVGSAGVDTFPEWIHDVPLVTRGQGIQAPLIAEYVIGALFAHEKRFWDGPVSARSAWSHKMLGSVTGKTLGIAGFGSIGQHVARLAVPLGLRVSALTRTKTVSVQGVHALSDLETLMSVSDHVVIAMPQTPETHRVFNAALFAKAKPGLHLINVARGTLINDDDLIAALDNGLIRAATLDVTAPEPLPEGHAFYSHPRIRLTPHVSGGSEDGDQRLATYLAQNLRDYLAGQPVTGRVERERGY
jgi:phosphoglycerate dehydrogenase-like enzyme